MNRVIKKLGDKIVSSVAGEWGSPEVNDNLDIAVLRSTNFANSGSIDDSNIVKRNASLTSTTYWFQLIIKSNRVTMSHFSTTKYHPSRSMSKTSFEH